MLLYFFQNILTLQQIRVLYNDV